MKQPKNYIEFNKHNHKYIYNVEKTVNGYTAIDGRIGLRMYMYYSLKEACTKYNQEVKEKIHVMYQKHYIREKAKA